MKILPLDTKIISYLKKRNITQKFFKQLRELTNNPQYPSLNVELLEPKKHGIYSFRIDKKYRALFFFRDDKQAIGILTITDHYR